MTIIETDDLSRAVIPGHRNQQFVMQENADGSVLLSPTPSFVSSSPSLRPRRRCADVASTAVLDTCEPILPRGVRAGPPAP